MATSKGKFSISQKLNEYVRIMKLARRPSREEFSKISRISGLGILLIGTIGFLIYLAMTVLPRAIAGT
ncbi:MAG: protein translocase SEC61 complex subunit gamma [Halobacteriota archaeon]|nr:protein translocase SEC61 complex subunit gamma [Halobacteriota archaeon]